MRLLLGVSFALLVLRSWAALRVGFGDSEALYATWALHPQPAYLDHPGLVGVVARAIGEGAVPTPGRTHAVTTVLATLVPWLVMAVARAMGAERRHAINAALVVAVVPEIAVGLFALTPDLVLAPLWLGALGLAAIGLGPGARDDLRRACALLGAGLLAGIAASAKVSGLLLILSLIVAYAQLARGSDRRAARGASSLWAWAGILAGFIVLAPIVRFEQQAGFPMLRHRFVDTQHGAGLALSNMGVLLGGQLLYLSPVVAWLAIVVARDLVRHRSDDAATRLLFASFVVPILPLTLFCIWSPVAEPHWIAPPLLALPLHAARRGGAMFAHGRLVKVAAGIGAALTVAAHAWVLVPSLGSLLPPDPVRADIASELYGWPTVIDAVKDQMATTATPYDPEGREVVVVGPHWTICAQLHAGLPGIHVGCATPIPDDFDRWYPRDDWRRANHVLFVTDTRFPGDGAEQLPAHTPASHGRVRILRGGRTARVFEFYLYSRRQNAAR